MKVTLPGKEKKIQELKGTRDLFGRVLYLAVNKGVDLDLVLRYLLTKGAPEEIVFFYSLVIMPATFGEIAKLILTKLFASTKTSIFCM